MHKKQTKKSFFTRLRSTTTRLAASYLLIIMIMSIGFSVVFYQTSARQLGRQIPSNSVLQERGYFGNNAQRRLVDELFEDRITEGRQALLRQLIILNMVAFVLGSGLSYVLARRTLRPIEANMAAQARFISDASHELRTPLTALKTTNEVALRRKTIPENEARTVLKQNVEEVTTLQSLTDNLLGLAGNTNPNHILEPIQAQDAATKAVNSVLPAAMDVSITIDNQLPAMTVLGQPQRLAQVLTILLDNAVKYSAKNTTITMTGHTQGKHAYIEVRDQGRGIRASDLPHIFDRFYRADQSRTKDRVAGYGIGLSLAKKIIEEDGGTISVASTFGSGSVFTIQLQSA